MKTALSRRHLLRGAGGVAIALPLLEVMGERPARAAGGGFPKRIVFLFTANGTIMANWRPTGTETAFTLGPILAPFQPYQKDLIILEGIDNRTKQLPQGTQPGHHSAGVLLTGADSQSVGTNPIVGGNNWTATNTSVDQVMANRLPPGPKFRSLQLRVGGSTRDNGNSLAGGTLSWAGPGRPLPGEPDPAKSFARLFGAGASGMDPTQLRAVIEQQRSVLDTVAEAYVDVARKLGTDDRRKLDAHLAGLREVEQRLTMAGATPAMCAPPTAGTVNIKDEASWPAYSKLYLDLLAATLACDLTRIVTLGYGTGASETKYTWLGAPRSHHDYSHDGDSNLDSRDKLTAINRWLAEQVASLVTRLKGLKEGSGTVFDSTLIVWLNELAKGNTHSSIGHGWLLAGSCGGALRTGRYLKLSGTNHNDLLVSLLNVMGVPDKTFGQATLCKGPIPGLA